MTFDYSTLVKNVICFDVLNTSIEEIQAACFLDEIAKKIEKFIEYFHRRIVADLDFETNPQFIYFDKNHFIGVKNNGGTEKDMNIWAFENKKRFTFINESNELEIYNSVEQELFARGTLFLEKELIRKIYTFFKEKQYFDKEFNHYANLYLSINSKLRLSVKEVFEKYGIEVAFLDTTKDFNADDLKLCGIFYHLEIPILLVFNNNKLEEYLGWNREYLLVIHKIEPLNKRKKVNKTDELNNLLDNINKFGIDSINPNDMNP